MYASRNVFITSFSNWLNWLTTSVEKGSVNYYQRKRNHKTKISKIATKLASQIRSGITMVMYLWSRSKCVRILIHFKQGKHPANYRVHSNCWYLICSRVPT